MDPFAAVPNGARHTALAELAQNGPLHHLVLPTSVPAWVITGYAEARAALTERFPTLELAADPADLEREPSLLFNKLRTLPVRVP